MMITLIEGRGVEGDAHCGELVKHRSRVRQDPTQPNLRQVHLIALEFLETLCASGFDVKPGDMGENLTTEGLDLIDLPRGTILEFENGPIIQLTGLRNPCSQIDKFADGMLAWCIEVRDDGTVVRKAGVMSIVIKGGVVAPGDSIQVTLPDEPHEPLERV